MCIENALKLGLLQDSCKLAQVLPNETFKSNNANVKKNINDFFLLCLRS